jgi:hypothetical protein
MGFRHERKCKALNIVVVVTVLTYVWIVHTYNEMTACTTVDLCTVSWEVLVLYFNSLHAVLNQFYSNGDKCCHPAKSIYFICNYTETGYNVQLIKYYTYTMFGASCGMFLLHHTAQSETAPYFLYMQLQLSRSSLCDSIMALQVQQTPKKL